MIPVKVDMTHIMHGFEAMNLPKIKDLVGSP